MRGVVIWKWCGEWGKVVKLISREDVSYELWVMSYELWVMNYELWIMSYELWVVNYELWIMNLMMGASISITKFSESRWNDSVFEGSEEHRRCSGKVTDFRLAGVEKLFPWWRDSSLRCASFRMTGFCFLITSRNLFQWENCFWNAKIFFLELLF